MKAAKPILLLYKTPSLEHCSFNSAHLLTHNRFVVPDWGVLRFDLHVPSPDTSANQNSVVRVFLDGQELQSSAFQELVKGEPTTTGQEYPAVDLRKFEPTIGARNGEEQSNRIGFAEEGFQTFQLDIPNKFRGKVATLKFEVIGGKTVYLDNVFFKSQHLLFGNPAFNGREARKDINTPVFYSGYIPYEDLQTTPPSQFFNNYLLEKPQYSLSYNDNVKTPNWVSYQLNKSWLGVEPRIDSFGSDPRLPFVVQTTGSDIKDDSKYQRGHLATFSHRNRNKQDLASTFLMTNIIPQPLDKPFDRWTALENYLTDIVENQNKELYIIAGRDGYTSKVISSKKIIVPESVWKVVLVLDKPGMGINDVTKDTLAFGIYFPNTLDANGNGQDPNNDWTANFILLANGREYGLFNVQQLEKITGYDFFSNIPKDIQDKIEGRPVESIEGVEGILEKLNGIKLISQPASLLADGFPLSEVGAFFDGAIEHNSIVDKIHSSTDQVVKSRSSISKIGLNQNSVTERSKFGSTKDSTKSVNVIQVSVSQIGIGQITQTQVGTFQVGIPDNRIIQPSFYEGSTKEIGSSEVGFSQISMTQIGSSQVNIPQNSTFEIDKVPSTFAFSDYHSTSEVSLTRSVPFQQIFSSDFPSHNLTSNFVTNIQSSATNIWSDLLQSQAPLYINFQITNLPTGQLAEAQITDFDSSGNPIGGTILIDDDANGVGWYIDPNPQDNSEYAYTLADWAYQATPDSEAYGKYDLLSTIFHEIAHLFGFIDGFWGFDKRIQTIDGTSYFIGDDFTAILDGEHLDSDAHPYDLLNTHLAPGMRKLPSDLDVKILQLLLAEGSKSVGTSLVDAETPSAPLTSAPLVGIANSDFSIDDPNNPLFGWNIRGKTQILNQQAVLFENSPLLSKFSQTFTIPENAKTLQFTLINSQLGTDFLPDAVEVALLDTNTNISLVDTINGLTNTDAFINLQDDGTAYFADNVNFPGANSSGTPINPHTPRTIQLDISHLTPGQIATLSFDLLGLGAKDAEVTIDNVIILTDDSIAPIANNDTASTKSTQPITINVINNDSDSDGSIDLLPSNSPPHPAMAT